MRTMEEIRRDVAAALESADTKALAELTREASPEEQYDQIEVSIEGLRGQVRATSKSGGYQPPVEAETGVVEALMLDVAMNEGASISSRTIGAVIRGLNRVGDTATLEQVRNAVDRAPARYAGGLRWCVPARDDDGTLIWKREPISENGAAGPAAGSGRSRPGDRPNDGGEPRARAGLRAARKEGRDVPRGPLVGTGGTRRAHEPPDRRGRPRAVRGGPGDGPALAEAESSSRPRGGNGHRPTSGSTSVASRPTPRSSWATRRTSGPTCSSAPESQATAS